jgi:hypothetical protein
MSPWCRAGHPRMTLVIGDITVSLDGLVTGPDGVEALHAWALAH